MAVLCETCLKRDVCCKFKATGGVEKCRDHKEERHGRWIVKRMPEIRSMEVKCSVCGWRDVDTYDAIVNYSEFNYCPNCGNPMDGGKLDV